jgi:hypothetical protein
MKLQIGIVLLGAALAAGCKKDQGKEGQPTPPVGNVPLDASAAPPVDDDAPPPPLTPAIPTGKIGVQIVDLTYGGVETPGLPAIKGDGSVIAAASFADDGGRGYMDAILRTLDTRTGAVTATMVLADPDKTSDAEQKEPSDLPRVEEEAKAAVTKANELFAAGDWRTMAGSEPLQVSDSAEYSDEITLGDLRYKLDVKKQLLTISRAGKTVASHKVTKLYALPKTAGDDDMCGGDAPFLRAIYTDPTAAKVLVEVGFVAGGHNCGAAGSVYTVVPLPT